MSTANQASRRVRNYGLGVLMVSMTLLMVGCGSASDPAALANTANPPDTGSAPDSTSPAEVVASSSTTTPDNPIGEIRLFDVDGMTVSTRTTLQHLPDQASLVRFTSTVSDSGDGPKLCTTGIEMHSPPRCSGPAIDGLDLDANSWTQTTGDVTWGVRAFVVTWPPVDGHINWKSDHPLPGEPPPTPYRGMSELFELFELPDSCRSITTFVDKHTLSNYAGKNPDRTAGVWLADGGPVMVLAVVEEHFDEVQDELVTQDAQPCLTPVSYSTAQLSAAHEQLSEIMSQSMDSPVRNVGTDVLRNRTKIEVSVADRNTVRAIKNLVEEPGLIHISGTAEILQGY